MNPTEYEYLSNFLLGASGLALGEGKEYLIEARLIPLAQSLGMEGITDLVQELRNGAEERLTSAVTEAMTTNETSFFRDKNPFNELTNTVLPNLIEARHEQKSLRIWCAATSTGQEPYSIVMTIKESFPQLSNWNVEILATDIDRTTLARSESGIYTQFEVQRGMPVQLLMKYFKQVESGWQISSDVRDRVRFEQLNLLDNFSRFRKFDIIFCRNVLIYFQNDTKKDIIDRLADVTTPDGYLFMGAAETVLGISERFARFKECKSAVYRPTEAVLA